jgi:hypothetical protein
MDNQLSAEIVKDYQRQLKEFEGDDLTQEETNFRYSKIKMLITLINLYESLHRCYHQELYEVDNYNDDVPF